MESENSFSAGWNGMIRIIGNTVGIKPEIHRTGAAAAASWKVILQVVMWPLKISEFWEKYNGSTPKIKGFNQTPQLKRSPVPIFGRGGWVGVCRGVWRWRGYQSQRSLSANFEKTYFWPYLHTEGILDTMKGKNEVKVIQGHLVQFFKKFIFDLPCTQKAF